MYRKSYDKNLLFQVVKKELCVKVMYIVKLWWKFIFSEDVQKLYLKIIFTNHKFPKLEN